MQVGGPPPNPVLPVAPVQARNETALADQGKVEVRVNAGLLAPADAAMKGVARELLQAAALLRPDAPPSVFGPKPGFATHGAPGADGVASAYIQILGSLPEEIVMFFALAMWQQARAGRAYEGLMAQLASASNANMAVQLNAGAFRAALATASELNQDAIESWQRMLRRVRDVGKIFAGETETAQEAVLFSSDQLANLKKLESFFRQMALDAGFDPL